VKFTRAEVSGRIRTDAASHPGSSRPPARAEVFHADSREALQPRRSPKVMPMSKPHVVNPSTADEDPVPNSPTREANPPHDDEDR
jgi:hypothetical protein